MFTEEINSDNITQAERMVCIPSLNEAANISFPTTKASEGLVQYFGDRTSVIVNCDNNSQDKTREAFLNTPTEAPKIYLSTPPGLRGKGRNLENLFQKAVEFQAKAIIVVEADLKSVTPQWIKHLGQPLLNDFDYVAPLYVRSKYDGTITNAIAYPLVRTLYGRRVRQPIAGDFGFSGRMAEIFAQKKAWSESVDQYGIDIWMTTLAMNNRLPICQAFLGRPKIHKPKSASTLRGSLFKQVVGAIFDMMTVYASFWKKVKWSKPTAIFGFGLGEAEMPPAVVVDQKNALFRNMNEGFSHKLDVWREALSEDVYNQILAIGEQSPGKFDFPVSLWAKTLYDMSVAYTKNIGGSRDELLDSLEPLFFGKIVSFVKKTERMSIQQTEELIENEAVIFEELKPYLINKWPS